MSLITRFAQPVQVARQATAGAYVDGLWVDGSPQALTIKASVQPVSGRERAMLPEGDREREMVKLYSDTELKPSSQANQKAGDVVTWEGRDYLVTSCQLWKNPFGVLGSHWKCMARLVDGEG